MITKQRAQEFGIEAQREDESDFEFRDRVSNSLRAMGHLIEAHEAFSNKLYDDPTGDAMTGIIGAVAQAMQGKSYRGNQIANDIATGVVAQRPKNDLADALILMMAMIG